MLNNLDNVVVKKPWGYEYLCYKNESLAIWLLHIENKKQTSFHCHTKKHTSLIVLSGKVIISFMRGFKKLSAIDKINIFRSRFHSTKAITNNVYLLEVETPIDKNDLVRLKDFYGRENLGYENSDHYLEKNNSHLNIQEFSKTKFNNTYLHHTNAKEIDLNSLTAKDLLIFTSGGVFADINKQLVYSGDTIDGESLNTLLSSFSIEHNTQLIHIHD
jgi:hypothetical protein